MDVGGDILEEDVGRRRGSRRRDRAVVEVVRVVDDGPDAAGRRRGCRRDRLQQHV